jgi:hypothetical protein
MENISSYLKRFSKLIPLERISREACNSVVRDELGISLHPRAVSLRRSVITIATDPLVKSEILMRKRVILKRINDLLAVYGKQVEDIR